MLESWRRMDWVSPGDALIKRRWGSEVNFLHPDFKNSGLPRSFVIYQTEVLETPCQNLCLQQQ